MPGTLGRGSPGPRQFGREGEAQAIRDLRPKSSFGELALDCRVIATVSDHVQP